MEEIEKDKEKKNLQLKIALARYYKLITAIIIIAIVASGYYFILEPKYQQVGSGGAYDLDRLQSELAQKQSYFEDLRELDANYQKVSKEKLTALEKILPAQRDIPGLFVQLQALAEEHSLFLASVSINEVPEAIKSKEKVSTIKRLNISLNLIGSENSGYDEIKEFLSTLEYNLRLFDVNAVYFSPDSPTYSINIFTYYQGE